MPVHWVRDLAEHMAEGKTIATRTRLLQSRQHGVPRLVGRDGAKGEN